MDAKTQIMLGQSYDLNNQGNFTVDNSEGASRFRVGRHQVENVDASFSEDQHQLIVGSQKMSGNSRMFAGGPSN